MVVVRGQEGMARSAFVSHRSILSSSSGTAWDTILPLESLISGFSAGFFSKLETKRHRPFNWSQDLM
jgi:hypothetical protein